MASRLVQSCVPCCTCKQECGCEDIGFEAQFVKDFRPCATLDPGSPPHKYAGAIRGWNSIYIETRWSAPPAWLTALLGVGETLYYVVKVGAPRTGRIGTAVADYEECFLAEDADYPAGNTDCTAATQVAQRESPASTDFWDGTGAPTSAEGPVIFRGDFTNPDPDLSTTGWCAALAPGVIECNECGRPGNVFLQALAVPTSGPPRELAVCIACPPGGDECKRFCCCPEEAPDPVNLKLIPLDEFGADAGEFNFTLIPTVYSGGGLAALQCPHGYFTTTTQDCDGSDGNIITIRYRHFQNADCTQQTWTLSISGSTWTYSGSWTQATVGNGCQEMNPYGDDPQVITMTGGGTDCFGAVGGMRCEISLSP